jgi:ketosteroid isomerase-like protein
MQENVEIVRSSFDGWNRGDVEAWLDGVHPDAEWSSAIARQVEGSGAASYRGHDELRRFWEEWHEVWELTMELTEVRDLGDTVLAFALVTVRGYESGIDLERRVGYVIEFEDGLVRTARSYMDQAAALEAAGLSE